MNATQYLLTKLAEEAVEVAQRALKAAQFGLDEVQPGQDQTNSDRLAGELNDMAAIRLMLDEECGVLFPYCMSAVMQKVEKVRKFRAYSESLGMVQVSQGGAPRCPSLPPMPYHEFIALALEHEDDHWDLRDRLKDWQEGAWADALEGLPVPSAAA